MSTQIIPNDVHVAGALSAQDFTPPAGCITAAAIEAAAGVEATKLQHRFQPVYRQSHGTATAAQRQVVHVVRGATATLVAFRCGVVVACIGNSTITIDLYKNGSSILSATTVLDSSNTAFSIEAAAGFSSTSLVAGDVLEVVVTVSAGSGTLGQGVFAVPTISEDAS